MSSTTRIKLGFFFSHPVFVEMRNWAADLGRSRAKRVRPCSAHVCICAQWRLTTYSLCLHSEVAILVCGNEKLLLSSCHAMPPIKMFPKLLLLARCSLAIPSRIPLWDSSPIAWLFFIFFKKLVAALFYILWPPFCQSIAELKMNAKYSYAVSELTPAAAKCPTLLMKLCSTLETNAQLPS